MSEKQREARARMPDRVWIDKRAFYHPAPPYGMDESQGEYYIRERLQQPTNERCGECGHKFCSLCMVSCCECDADLPARVATTGAGEGVERCAGCRQETDVGLLLCPTCVDKGHAECCPPPATVAEGEAQTLTEEFAACNGWPCTLPTHSHPAPPPVQPPAAPQDVKENDNAK